MLMMSSTSEKYAQHVTIKVNVTFRKSACSALMSVLYSIQPS